MSAFHKYIIVIRYGTIFIEARCGCTVTMATVILSVEWQKNSSEIRISRIFRFHESKYADTDNKLADTVENAGFTKDGTSILFCPNCFKFAQ